MTSDYAGRGIAISPDAPDAMISSLNVLRSVVQPAGPNPTDAAPDLGWHLSGRTVQKDDLEGLRVFGDLTVIDEGWFIGVTVAAIVTFRNALVEPPSTWSPDEVERQVEVYGPWVSHSMYDLATLVARQLGVQSQSVRVLVPPLTPEPTFAHRGGEG